MEILGPCSPTGRGNRFKPCKGVGSNPTMGILDKFDHEEKIIMNYVEAPVIVLPRNMKRLFLGGGISGCPNWQKDLYMRLVDLNITVLNPRRENFPIDDPNSVYEQIKWEHNMLRRSDMIVFWFCKETMCPIVLYELGVWSNTDIPIVIGMHPEYVRKQDVDIQTKLVRPDIPICYDFDEFVKETRKMIMAT